MEMSPRSTIFYTAASIIFFTFFHKYIAWYTTAPDGSITRLSMLTDDYFIWLPIAITASILAIVAYTVMLFYDKYRFRMTVNLIGFIIGITVVVSLLSIFPFDFSVIPNATVANVVPIVLTVFLILQAVFYEFVAFATFIKLKNYIAKPETG
ncbi:hypothetical protein ACFLYS_00475 [Chloroflexota bacterium]